MQIAEIKDHYERDGYIAPLRLFSEEYPVDPRVSLGLWPVRALRHRLL